MKNRFISLLTSAVFTGVALLAYTNSEATKVSAFKYMSTDSSSSSSSSSSTTLPLVMPAAHSAGPNSYLTIGDAPMTSHTWPECKYGSQTYCFETVSISHVNDTEVSGSATVPQFGIRPYSNCHGNSGGSLDPAVTNPPCNLEGEHWMEIQLTGSFTVADLVNTYHWKVRTGKIEPSVLMLGDVQKTVVSGNATSGWVLEVWAKPVIKAYLSGCYSASSCGETSVATYSQYGVSGYARMLAINSVSMPSVSSVALRDALRGTYISTNGMSQSWNFTQDTFFVTAVSPHFLPPDASGKSEVTPGFVRVFLPASYLTLDRGYKDITMVTADRVKMTVSGEKATAKVTAINGGLLVDTGVEHFSSPNPELSVLKASEPSVVAVGIPSQATAVTAILRKGSTKSLSSLVKTTGKQKPKWTAKGQCKIVGTKLVALKKSGSCTVKLQILNSKKKYVTTVTKTFSVS